MDWRKLLLGLAKHCSPCKSQGRLSFEQLALFWMIQTLKKRAKQLSSSAGFSTN
jgi:hypothetical protein